MHPDLKPGSLMPNFSLPTHEGQVVTLSELAAGLPTAVIFVRGHY